MTGLDNWAGYTNRPIKKSNAEYISYTKSKAPDYPQKIIVALERYKAAVIGCERQHREPPQLQLHSFCLTKILEILHC